MWVYCNGDHTGLSGVLGVTTCAVKYGILGASACLCGALATCRDENSSDLSRPLLGVRDAASSFYIESKVHAKVNFFVTEGLFVWFPKATTS